MPIAVIVLGIAIDVIEVPAKPPSSIAVTALSRYMLGRINEPVRVLSLALTLYVPVASFNVNTRESYTLCHIAYSVASFLNTALSLALYLTSPFSLLAQPTNRYLSVDHSSEPSGSTTSSSSNEAIDLSSSPSEPAFKVIVTAADGFKGALEQLAISRIAIIKNRKYFFIRYRI